VSATVTALAPDLDAALRRLRLRAMRQLAPELLVTSKTQRWSPEEFLRTLLEAEISSRDASNASARLKLAGFPVTKTLEEFDVSASSIPRATFNYLASLEWINARENLCLVGPAGTGKSHLLVALGHEAVAAGHKVRYFSAPALIETLYRGLADNSVGKVIDQILRADLILIDEIGFAPMDDTGAQLFFRLIAAAMNTGPWALAPTGHLRSGVGSYPSTTPRSVSWTGSSITALLSSRAASHFE
jgi:DNA replication protein DnaC